MLDRLAEAISFISMAPWLRPAFALALSIISSSLGWLASDVPWATIVLVLSIALALWAYAEGLVGTISGFVASLVGFYLLVGLTNNLTILRFLPHGCVTIDSNTANYCIDVAINKASRN